ncbi:huntingtin-interacting protein 1-related protein-like [Teleopsis dalmanni]|uniref:huntingtin-interacting protein 1-related protein-like n=1 Tax=Teleopsis dalmanni TaxID=139649 RepID=UPI0018CDEA0A|nr:huntingtin-interacting protein 1-related protein-like [Teleopsis dalmanni]
MTTITNKEYYSLNMSIVKALNSTEAPLKMKHARSIIITTHLSKDVSLLWKLLTQQPLMENRFIAWKFCHLVHKVLREGQENCINHFQTHKKFILEMGKHWGYLQDGVGACIQAYSQLLVVKLDFHHKNSLLPGSLLINFSKIENFACSDINIYFQLCVEIFDYLDEIINVQSKIFFSINSYRMSSMSPQGQCRLAPLITLIQDSNPLYDISVRIMFKLHNELPNDILIGHRDRFRDLFFKIKMFYDNVRPLQYFADLLQVPILPEVAPNFSSKIDFGSYVPPTVFCQPDEEPDNLIDPSILEEPIIKDTVVEESNDIMKLTYLLEQKQIVIQQIEDEINTLKSDSIHREQMLTNEIAFLQKEIKKLKQEKNEELAKNMMETQHKDENQSKSSLDISKNNDMEGNGRKIVSCLPKTSLQWQNGKKLYLHIANCNYLTNYMMN